MKPNSLTITYLSKVSMASLNGSDKDVDNVNPIKKVTLPDGTELPYVSAQAIRRALRDRLEEMGHPTTELQPPSETKGAIKTSMDPVAFIDDDLFGFMDAASGGTTVRTSPVRVEAMLALSVFRGDLDYATNFMGKKINLNPNIFETEIHSGVYRGTILIELDRVGRGYEAEEDKKEKKVRIKAIEYVDNQTKAQRVIALLDALRMLWSSGRQTRFLADISPKFVAAAMMRAKNPIFLESVSLDDKGQVEIGKLKTVVDDYDKFIDNHVFGAQEAVFARTDESVLSLKEAFEKVEAWVKSYYEV